MKLTEQQQKEFKERIRNFEDLRNRRFALFEGVFIALIVSAIILFVDMIAGADPIFKGMLILLLMIISWSLYKRMLIQTQKPVIALGNIIATRESDPINITGKDGVVYSIFRISDVVEDNKMRGKK